MSGPLPLRMWLAIALLIIVGIPALTTWALSSALAARPAPGVVASMAAVRDLLQDGAARWSDPAWQRVARQRLATLHVDVVLDDAAGHHVFATPNAPDLLPWGGAPGTQSVRLAGIAPQPLKLMLTIPFFATSPARADPPPTHQQTDGVSSRVMPALLGTAFVLLIPPPAVFSPPAWLVPVAGLAALLVTLGAVTWGLGLLVLRPLAAMSRAAGQIAGGDLEVRLSSSRAREVAEVAEALTGMSAALREALRRQDALEEERRLFIGAIAHDLHTPLFVLRGYLQGLENGVVTAPDKVAEYIAECRVKVDALARLIADLFAYTKVAYLDQTMQEERFRPGHTAATDPERVAATGRGEGYRDGA